MWILHYYYYLNVFIFLFSEFPSWKFQEYLINMNKRYRNMLLCVQMWSGVTSKRWNVEHKLTMNRCVKCYFNVILCYHIYCSWDLQSYFMLAWLRTSRPRSRAKTSFSILHIVDCGHGLLTVFVSNHKYTIKDVTINQCVWGLLCET